MSKLNRNIIILGIVSLFTDIGSEMLAPVLPLFLANVLQADKTAIGLIEGIAGSTASILKLFSGYLTDKMQSRKPLILAGYGLSALVKPLLLIATGWPLVLLYRFLDRIGKGIRTSPRDAVIADACTAGERGTAFGFHKMMDTTGAALGPVIAFIILSVAPEQYKWVFVAAIIPGILATLTILFIRDSKSCNSEKKPLPSLHFKVFGKDYVKFLALAAVFTIATYSDAFLLLRAQDFGVKARFIPLLLLYSNVIQAILSMPAGILSDRIGRKKLIIAGYSIFALMGLGFAFGSRQWHAWALFTLLGLFNAATAGNQRVLVVDLVKPEVRGTALGTYHAVIGLAALPSGLLAGFLWQSAGAGISFLFSSCLAAAAAVLLIGWKWEKGIRFVPNK